VLPEVMEKRSFAEKILAKLKEDEETKKNLKKQKDIIE